MTPYLVTLASRLFDPLEVVWESATTRRRAGSFLVVSFLASLVLIECNRQGWLPASLAELLPTNHFYAVKFAFTLVLIYEVIGLVFSLVGSVANSVGNQFEILSLILLRQSFERLTEFGEPVRWELVSHSILEMLADAGGALAIFALLGLYYRLQRHAPISDDTDERRTFIAGKKLIALVLLLTFVAAGVWDLWLMATGHQAFDFFEAFYTILIFADVLLVLISMRWGSSYAVVFRNSGFAVATVVLRLALTAPSYYKAVLGVAGAAFAVALTLAYNFMSSPRAGAERS